MAETTSGLHWAVVGDGHLPPQVNPITGNALHPFCWNVADLTELAQTKVDYVTNGVIVIPDGMGCKVASTRDVYVFDVGMNDWVNLGGGSDLFGSGTPTYLPVFTAANTIGDSPFIVTSHFLAFPTDGGAMESDLSTYIFRSDGTHTTFGSTGRQVKLVGTSFYLSTGGECVLDNDQTTRFKVLPVAYTGSGLAWKVTDWTDPGVRYATFRQDLDGSVTDEVLGLNLFNGLGIAGIAYLSTKPTLVSSTPYVVLITDNTIYVDATSGNAVETLPPATGSGRILTIKKIDSSANTVTVTADTSGTPDLIDGAATFVISAQYEALTIQDYATNAWGII